MKINRVRVGPNLYRDPTTKKYFGRREQAGKTIWRDFKTTTPKRAETMRDAWVLDAAELDPNADSFMLGALVDLWLATKSALRPRSLHNFSHRSAIFRKSFKGGMNRRVSDVRSHELVTWMNEQAAKRNWKSATFNSYRGILRDLFEVAVSNRILARSPFEPRQIPPRGKRFGKKAAEENLRRHIPTYDQFLAIIANVRANGRHPSTAARSADFLELLGEAACGQAEAEDLHWKNIRETHIEFTRRKTNVRFDVPLFRYAPGEPCLFTFIQRLRAQPHRDGPVFSITDPHIALANACKRLNLPHFTPRNLRQMGIVRQLDKGATFAEVAEHQGHQDGGWLISTTYSFTRSDNESARRSRLLERMRLAPDSRAEAAPVK